MIKKHKTLDPFRKNISPRIDPKLLNPSIEEEILEYRGFACGSDKSSHRVSLVTVGRVSGSNGWVVSSLR